MFANVCSGQLRCSGRLEAAVAVCGGGCCRATLYAAPVAAERCPAPKGGRSDRIRRRAIGAGGTQPGRGRSSATGVRSRRPTASDVRLVSRPEACMAREVSVRLAELEGLTGSLSIFVTLDEMQYSWVGLSPGVGSRLWIGRLSKYIILLYTSFW